jgi:copper(I)-binding protein
MSDAYVNEPTVPERTGVFGVIANTGTSEVTLTAASVPKDLAESATIHETVTKDGEMVMQEVPAGLPVPAGGQLVLKSGGFHIMLMNPKVTVGQTVPLTLTFSNGATVTVDAPVKAAAPMPSSSSSM